MKRISYPQLVILLDVLFVFLFVLILQETPPTAKIILPESKLEVGGFLSYEYEKGKFLWYIPKYEMWSDAEKDKIGLYNEVGQFSIGLDCDEACLKIIKNKYNNIGNYNNNIKVVITNDLFDNISRITYLACQTNNSNACGNIIFNITPEWEIDKTKLLIMNPFLKNIPGIIENF